MSSNRTRAAFELKNRVRPGARIRFQPWAHYQGLWIYRDAVVLKCKVAEVEVLEIMARGFRAPNGMTVGPNDIITVSDHQGHWMPSSHLNFIRKGAFYGMTPAAHRQLVRSWRRFLIDFARQKDYQIAESGPSGLCHDCSFEGALVGRRRSC